MVGKVTPTYHAAFSGNRRNVPLARNAIASFARICGFSHDEVEDIRLAAGEALNNAVEHGHANRPQGFSVLCTFRENEMTIEIRDNGDGFAIDPADGQAPTLDGARGFGIYLMRRLMDAVRYDHDGTRVRLIRRHIESESETLTV